MTNTIIVHFPMGAGGNILRNIFSLSPGYEMLGPDRAPMADAEKSQFLTDYYRQDVTSETWLRREWSIRTGLYTRYYDLGIPRYFNPANSMAYDNHGNTGVEDMGKHLSHYDRYRINEGTIPDQTTEWTLADCQHIVIEVDDLDYLAKIYNSKNPKIDQFEHMYKDFESRYCEFLRINSIMYGNITRLQNYLTVNKQRVYTIHVAELFADNGYTAIQNLNHKLNLSVDPDVVKNIHGIWLQSTREVYYNYFKEELKL